MTLRKKTLLVMTVILAAVTAALILTLRIFIHTGFSRIEESDVLRNAVSAVSARFLTEGLTVKERDDECSRPAHIRCIR